MRCRRARTILAAREHGPVGNEAAAALERHLETCVACAARAEDETRLSEALSALRVEMPFEIDVTARVVAELAELTPEREEVSARLLGWAAAAAVAGACAVAGLFWVLLPEWSHLAQDGWTLASAMQAVTLRMVSALESVAAVPLDLASRLLRFLITNLPSAEVVRPTAVTSIALLTTAMAATIVLVVGRDLKRPAWQQEQP